MFYGEIYKLAHESYEVFLESLRMKIDYFASNEFVLPIIHSSADYLKPMKTSEVFNCVISVTRLKESSFELTYDFERDSQIYSSVKTVHVCVSKKEFKKVKMPAELFEGLNANLLQ
ncbi:MAG: thioesterase family protein [Melioribacteraceae bacterium]|nr:thioesterase family protein [Melioribacteraceae bacterium]